MLGGKVKALGLKENDLVRFELDNDGYPQLLASAQRGTPLEVDYETHVRVGAVNFYRQGVWNEDHWKLPGPDAYKPGDVLKAMNGKTIEVWNTDAEGRLILADALCLAVQQEPDVILDMATLTGAVVTALGSKVAGIMGNNKRVIDSVIAAGLRADEAYCELPLVEDYKDNIKGNIAELLNISKVRGEAGSIIGGLFLQEFVSDIPWAHLDIAGTAFSSGEYTSYSPKGGTGAPVRTLLEWLEAL
jgi:leucyl aminopeptidase